MYYFVCINILKFIYACFLYLKRYTTVVVDLQIWGECP